MKGLTEVGIIFLVAIIVLAVRAILASVFDDIAKMKGHDGGYFAWVFFFGIYGMLVVAALPDRGNSKEETEKKPDDPYEKFEGIKDQWKDSGAVL